MDAGLSLEALERELRKLPVSGFHMHAERVGKRGLAATYLDVHVPGEDDNAHEGGHHQASHRSTRKTPQPHAHEGIAHRKLGDVLAILRAAGFPSAVEEMAAATYRRLAHAEARVHGVAVDHIAFHEVGQIDAIVDIAGAALGLHLLGIERVFCSALPCGRGRIKSAHGEMPSPAPATVELLRDVPTYDLAVDGEFVTPTGAAILTTVASFDPRPDMTLANVGYGAGRSDFPFPNVLRVLIGDAIEAGAVTSAPDEVVQIETNIDDMNPQLYGHVAERLFASGALDVWTQAAGMKKGRPGIVLSALVAPAHAAAVEVAMLAETTSIGVRSWRARRVVLPRKTQTLSTTVGSVRVKIVDGPGGRRARPEYDDVRAIAVREGKPLADIMATVEREVAELLDEA